jgi:hypothetical protein
VQVDRFEPNAPAIKQVPLSNPTFSSSSSPSSTLLYHQLCHLLPFLSSFPLPTGLFNTMAISTFLKIAVVALLGSCAVAHPELSKEEMVEYQDLVARHTDALGRCLESRELREINARMLEHRGLAVRHLQKARGLEAREAGKSTGTLLFFNEC